MNFQYQLRRIGLPASVDKVKNLYRITSDTTMIGRGQSVDVFLDSNIRKGLISRAHAQIIQKETDDGIVHEIFDSSLNGTYVNDFRIEGSVILKAGDTIAFGHLQGALTKPGTLAPQKETEFLFKFEKCMNPEVKEEMVDLTDKELNNNSSVFMSPKSPLVENGESLSGMGCRQSNHDAASIPPEKKVKYEEQKYLDDEEDLKSVVTMATAKINSATKPWNGNSSDDGSFVIECKVNQVHTEQVLPSGGGAQHPRNKVVPPSYVNKPLHTNNKNTKLNSAALRLPSKPIPPKKVRAKKPQSARINGGTESEESEVEIESESESEYLEESDSEKSEEIPDDSSDNEYVPKGKPSSTATKAKHKAIAIPTVALKKTTSKKTNIEELEKSKKRKKRSNSFTHDKCDAANCKIPSGNLKTVTWVQCDDCDDWYHVSCSGLSAADAKKDDTIFQCGCS